MNMWILLPILSLSGPAYAQTAASPAEPVPAQTAPATAPATAPTQAAPVAQAADAGQTALTPEGAKRMQQVETQLKSLHDKLKIAPAQQKLWDDFAEARRANVHREDRQFQAHPPSGNETALDMMRDYAATTQSYASGVQTVLPKFEALYNDLTPAQKGVADRDFAEHRQQRMQHGKK